MRQISRFSVTLQSNAKGTLPAVYNRWGMILDPLAIPHWNFVHDMYLIIKNYV